MPTGLKILKTNRAVGMLESGRRCRLGGTLHRRSTAQFVHRVKRLTSNRCRAIFIL
jgi:hypothetical protein